MEAVQASKHVYVVKVRSLPDPALLFPSERRYSALTVAGLAAGHALLGGVALLLGALALSWDPPQGQWMGHLGAGLWLGVGALQASACGVLAWRRWYEDRYIAWFFRSSVLAAVVAGAGLVLTATALAHLHENVLSPTVLLEHNALSQPSVGADEGSGGGGPSWLDLADSNSSTISTGGVFSDLVRDQEHDLVAADSTRHEDLAVGSAEPQAAVPGPGEPEWSVLRWVPVPVSPRASAQVRSLVGANVLVACFLELLWALLGARLAWHGMKASDVDLSAPAKEPRPHHNPAAHAASTPALGSLKPALVALERGAADGKVDVDADLPAGGPDAGLNDGKAARPKQTATASPQRRRRAPGLPGLPGLDLEQHTMNLEEKVARLVGSGPASA